jgi:hypothetical protein
MIESASWPGIGEGDHADRETQKQMDLLYNTHFQIQQINRKIARIEGKRTEEEKLELQTTPFSNRSKGSVHSV